MSGNIGREGDKIFWGQMMTTFLLEMVGASDGMPNIEKLSET